MITNCYDMIEKLLKVMISPNTTVQLLIWVYKVNI